MKIGHLLAVSAMMVSVGAVSADTVTLSNGDKISGTIEQVTPANVTIATPYAGKLTIDRVSVKTLFSEKPVAIVRQDTTSEQKFLSPAASGTGWQETAAFVPRPPVDPTSAPVRHTKYLFLGPDWTNELAIGLINTTGNDETTSFVGALNFDYKKKPDQLTIKFEGAYGINNGTNNAALFAQSVIWRHDYNQKWYGYINEDARYDGIKGISFQGTGTVGLGYYLVRTEKFLLDMRAGPGVTYQQTFDGNEDINAAMQAGVRAEYVFNDHVSATHETVYTVAVSDLDIWHINSETALKLKLDIERGLGLKLAFVDDYEGQPSAGRKNNDTRLTIALTFGF